MKSLREVLCVCVVLICFSPLAMAKTSKEGLWVYDGGIGVPTLLDPADALSEVVYLPANIFVPTSDDPDARFPALIFISSWGVNEYEYALQAELLAEQGYVVLSYTARGFYGSPGLIGTAGAEDQADVSSAIDYVIDQYPVDPEAIGLSGVSYGAGISLLAAMADPRVKAVGVMSGWVDLVDSLWAGFTPNAEWLDVLLLSAQPIPYLIRNRPSPEIEENYDNMKAHQNVDAVKSWGAERSAITYIDQANSRDQQPAIFVSNNMHDYLFQPNSLFDFFSQYSGPWRLDLNRGTHATAEASGLLWDEDHEIWQVLNVWFDHYLKGVDNGIETRKPVSVQVLNTRERESYDVLEAHDEVLNFHLLPESGIQGGGLSLTEVNEVPLTLSFDTLDSVATAGGILGSLQHTNRTLDTLAVDLANGVMFRTAELSSTLHLRGEASLTLNIEAQDKAQYFVYLYYLDAATGIANWIGHAPFTCHQSEGCATNPGAIEPIEIAFYWTAVDVPAGTQLLLVIDGVDSDYWRYDDTPESNRLSFSATQASVLRLPVVSETPEYDEPWVEEVEEDSRSLSGGSASGSSGGVGGALSLSALFLLGMMIVRRKGWLASQ